MSGSPDATHARPVVVAVGPDGSDVALRHAVTLALHDRVALHVLHVVELAVAPGTGPVAADLLEAGAREGAHVLDRATAHARDLVAAGVPVTGELAHGDVTGRVVVAALTASYVVLQQASRADVRPRAGEVCSQVAARVDVPVVCVPPSWGDGLRPRTVTVAVKDPMTSGPLVGQAARAAVATGAGLRVLHVAAAGEHAEARRLLEEQLQDQRAEQPDLPSGTAWVDVVEGSPVPVLRDAARSARLLVLGRHHRRQPGGLLLGPVARVLARHAACPVLLATPRQSGSSAEWVFQTEWA